MATTQANSQERIARQLLTQSPGLFLGIDGDDAANYWDSYESAIAVVPRDAESVDNAKTFELDETPCAELADWCEHVRGTRGWDVGPHVAGSLVGDLAQAVEA
ncbi:hypothetical protein EGH21_19405 [Halomicroarcula sp. F13]|uniref:Uncharacterized protein n=1 Tax=Haloarcula rubra TaxID=2487747 RepID=A0AAW4PV51_9EURY|nr:hypothetical protein [Halomicroarcula rubra]MBX0325196.1 hypothetical protein [Halomicroarcula rubra]